MGLAVVFSAVLERGDIEKAAAILVYVLRQPNKQLKSLRTALVHLLWKGRDLTEAPDKVTVLDMDIVSLLEH